ncbi:hypothetical protein [Endomicrobium proavitum]|uniref:Uncharacterized protein n=1 Tax=Endomicrobium proavitum TaxID=1408281 RepID=A0A0G3WJS8_9BACT|nr:hypothetical protein [Endomicrobium proavitum]AKL98135.1 hypothetical protein Epro_0756 [Endomicrobium proavitum]
MEDKVALGLVAQLGALVEELKRLNQNIEKMNSQKPQERSFSPRSFGGHGGGFGKKSFGGFHREGRHDDRDEKRSDFAGRESRGGRGDYKKFFKKKKSF